jgi:hypothetical protein
MKFLVAHPLPPGTRRADIEKLQKSVMNDPDIRGYRSFLNLSESKGFCIFEAPDKTRLANWLTKNKMPYESITEIELEGYRGQWIQTEVPVHSGA